MVAYKIDFGLSASVDQTKLVEVLRSAGCDVIQTASGICFKSRSGSTDIRTVLKDASFADLMVSEVRADSSELSPDVRKFLET